MSVRLGMRLIQADLSSTSVGERAKLNLLATARCEKTTHTAEAQTRSSRPVFDEFLTFEAHNPAFATLEVKIINQHTIRKDSVLGQVLIEVQDVKANPEQYAAATWYQMWSHGRCSGRVELQLYYLGDWVRRNLRVLCCTWNLGNAQPPSDLSEWLAGVQEQEHDLVAVGVQECDYKVRQPTADAVAAVALATAAAASSCPCSDVDLQRQQGMDLCLDLSFPKPEGSHGSSDRLSTVSEGPVAGSNCEGMGAEDPGEAGDAGSRGEDLDGEGEEGGAAASGLMLQMPPASGIVERRSSRESSAVASTATGAVVHAMASDSLLTPATAAATSPGPGARPSPTASLPMFSSSFVAPFAPLLSSGRPAAVPESPHRGGSGCGWDDQPSTSGRGSGGHQHHQQQHTHQLPDLATAKKKGKLAKIIKGAMRKLGIMPAKAASAPAALASPVSPAAAAAASPDTAPPFPSPRPQASPSFAKLSTGTTASSGTPLATSPSLPRNHPRHPHNASDRWPLPSASSRAPVAMDPSTSMRTTPVPWRTLNGSLRIPSARSSAPGSTTSLPGAAEFKGAGSANRMSPTPRRAVHSAVDAPPSGSARRTSPFFAASMRGLWSGTASSGKSEPLVHAVSRTESASADRANRRHEWKDHIKECMGSNYTLVKSVHVGQIRLLLFARVDMCAAITRVEKGYQATGIANIASNKGGVAVGVKLWDTELCFVNCHLAAHQDQVEARNRNYSDIVRGIRMGPHCMDVLTGYHHVFWMGDLNYRLDWGQQAVKATKSPSAVDLEDMTGLLLQGQYSTLLAHDQLHKEMSEQRAFLGFTEPGISFAPTFKVHRAEGSQYQPLRSPAWCDRVLYRCNVPKVSAFSTRYLSAPGVPSSDHKPVSAAFEVPTIWVQHEAHGSSSGATTATAPGSGSERGAGRAHVNPRVQMVVVLSRLEVQGLEEGVLGKDAHPALILSGPCLEAGHHRATVSLASSSWCHPPSGGSHGNQAPGGSSAPGAGGGSGGSGDGGEVDLVCNHPIELTLKQASLEDARGLGLMVRLVDKPTRLLRSSERTLARGVLPLGDAVQDLLDGAATQRPRPRSRGPPSPSGLLHLGGGGGGGGGGAAPPSSTGGNDPVGTRVEVSLERWGLPAGRLVAYVHVRLPGRSAHTLWGLLTTSVSTSAAVLKSAGKLLDTRSLRRVFSPARAGGGMAVGSARRGNREFYSAAGFASASQPAGTAGLASASSVPLSANESGKSGDVGSGGASYVGTLEETRGANGSGRSTAPGPGAGAVRATTAVRARFGTLSMQLPPRVRSSTAPLPSSKATLETVASG